MPLICLIHPYSAQKVSCELWSFSLISLHLLALSPASHAASKPALAPNPSCLRAWMPSSTSCPAWAWKLHTHVPGKLGCILGSLGHAMKSLAVWITAQALQSQITGKEQKPLQETLLLLAPASNIPCSAPLQERKLTLQHFLLKKVLSVKKTQTHQLSGNSTNQPPNQTKLMRPGMAVGQERIPPHITLLFSPCGTR